MKTTFLLIFNTLGILAVAFLAYLSYMPDEIDEIKTKFERFTSVSESPMVYTVGKPATNETEERLEPCEMFYFPPMEPITPEEAEAINRDIDASEQLWNGEQISENWDFSKSVIR